MTDRPVRASSPPWGHDARPPVFLAGTVGGAGRGALAAELAHVGADLADVARALSAVVERLGAIAERAENQLAEPTKRALMGGVVTPEPQALLSVRTLADRLSVDPKTVRRWREAGTLPPAIAVAGVLRWRAEAIDAWLLEREEQG